jgi:hypothetical protein
MHCRRTFMSTAIWFQRVVGDPRGFKGFWMCPTPNCDGAGFTFDIFPTDPDHPANDGWRSDEDEDEEYDDDDDDVDEDEFVDGELGDVTADVSTAQDRHAREEPYDPDVTKWKQLDELSADDDADDLEGEEWKLGLQPGERPPEPDWMEQARREREAEEREYDEPDRRPREIDWSDREDREAGPGWSDDEIPF